MPNQRKSKEEILLSELRETPMTVSVIDSPEPDNQFMISLYLAFDKFAQQMAIEFAEWINDNDYLRYELITWHKFSVESNQQQFTTEELYTLFLNSKTKQ